MSGSSVPARRSAELVIALTGQQALSSAWPEPRKQLPSRATRLDPFKSLIGQTLRADLDAPCPRRFTSR